MTLIMSVHSREHIWLLADRRLSYGGKSPPRDDATKILTLETNDGIALLGYAGIGATPKGTEPSEWMKHCLRGRNLSLEHSLGTIADAANRALPQYLAQMPGGAHTIICPAFVRGIGPRLYTIDNVVDHATGEHLHRFTSHQRPGIPPNAMGLRIYIGGTGALHFTQQPPTWPRALLSLVNAHDRGKLSPGAVADHLATLNHRVHLATKNGTVGHRCIVAYLQRRDARHIGPGGEHFCYTGVLREPNRPALPTIVNGRDVQAVGDVMGAHIWEAVGDNELDQVEIDHDELNRLVGLLPTEPDDRLR